MTDAKMLKRQLAEAVKIIADLKKSLAVYECRKSICRFLDDFFADIDVVSESLKNHGDKSECFHMLMWCLHCLRNEPQIYILLHPTSGSTTPPKPGELSKEVLISEAFCMWFIGRLVRLLGRPECAILHKQCREMISLLLQVIRAKEMGVFKHLAAEMVHALGDLTQISDKLFTENPPEFVTLNRFQVSLDKVKQSHVEPGKNVEEEGLVLQNVNIVIVEPEQCELLQINLTKIVHSLLSDFNVVDPKHAQILWGCLCCHLEFGDIQLKICSLSMLSDLLDISGHPILVLDYFLACIAGLWEMLLSGCIDLQESEIFKLEEASAKMMESVIRADTKILRITGISVPQAEEQLTRLAEMAVKLGLAKIHTHSLRQALSNWVCHLLGKFPPDLKQSELFQYYRLQLTSALFGVFGSTVPYQFIVNPLHELMLIDLHGKISKTGEPTGTEFEKDKTIVYKRPGLSQKRKRKPSEEGDGNLEKQSKVYGDSLQRMRMSLINRKSDYMCCLKVVQVVIELAARGINHCHKTDKQASTCVLRSWLSKQLLQQICDMWAEFLFQDKTSLSPSIMHSGISIIIESIGTLLALQDTVLAEIDILSEFAWILSLPWLPNDPSWLDLRPVRAKEIAQLSNSLSDAFDTSTLCESLKVLSLLPKDIASKWRIHIFTQTFADSNPEIRLASLQAIPEFLFNLGPNGNHLVTDFLHPLVQEKHKSITETLAKTLGVVACVVSRKAVYKCGEFSKSCSPLYKSYTIKCTMCDDIQGKLDVLCFQKERSKGIEPALFSPFLHLLDTGDIAVKKAFIGSIKQLFSHICIRSHNQTTVTMLTQCLTLVDDSDYQVRKQFSQVIHHLLGEKMEGDGEKKGGVDTIIMNRLQQVYFQAHTDNNIRLQETLLHTIGQLGRFAENDLLLVVLVSLLKSLLSVTPLIAAVAGQELRAVAKHKKISCQSLFSKFRQGICKFLVEAMHDASTTGSEVSPEVILHKVARALNYQDVKTFIQDPGSEKHIVPFLVSKATPVASNLLKMISTLSNMNTRRFLLAHNMKYIFSYLVRLCQAPELEKALAFLQSEAGMDLGKLIRLDFQRLHNELLLHLSSNYQQVFNGLRTLSSYDENYQGPKDITTAEQMADYLEPRLLGVLASFDSQLIKSNTPLEDKQLAMESLIDIIQLMGPKHIGSIRHKVMNTLRLGRQFVEISCRAWNCFVRSLDLPLLGTMLSQIVATLLPLLHELPKQVAEIFSYMIVESRSALHQHFHEIYFLPDIPELTDANAVLKQYADGPTRQSDLRTRLAHSTQGITHENLDVRRHALSKLRKLLREEKMTLNEYVMNSEVADPVISQLVSVLMTGCRESDVEAELLYAECLGELGAIDPGRLELMTNNPKEELTKFQASVEDDNFAVGLINEVLKAFLSATEPRIQDCSAFALQDLLQIYEISEGKETPNKLWRRFPEHMQEILMPLLSSRYKLTTEAQWDKYPKPIYQSAKGNNFKDWVSNWTGYLIHLISRVNQQGKAARVFQACSACIRHNTQVALYILPHVAVQVLQDGKPEDATELYNEILEVVNHVKKPDTRPRGHQDFRHKSAQTVFSVLDYLTKWCRHRAQVLSASSSNSKEASYLNDSGYRSINGFLDRVPKDSLAEASVNCKAYTRALMHFEQFVSQSNLQKHLDFLQRLYVAMDEPDGVLGVAAIRQSPPTLIQQILTHESLGEQQDAEACYERAIQTEPDEVSHHQGLMGSLMELGQMNKALLHATGVLAEKPAWSGQLNTYRVEAAWKLGSWDKLEMFCRGETHRRNWAVGIGRVLLAAKDKKEEEFSKQLEIVRREQMGPLAAASMEMGSYQRGYENIVRLHMLNEMEEVMRVLLDFPTQTDSGSSNSSNSSQGRRTPADLINQWQETVQMCQLSFRVQEPILTLRRTLLTLCQSEQDMGLHTMIGKWWLWSAKVARKAGYLQTAYSSLLQASTYKLSEFFLEKAKWLWEKGNNDEAISCLEKGIAEHFSNMSQLKMDDTEQGRQKRKTYAEALLLSGRYSEDTSSLESNAIMKQYKEVIEIYPRWEDGHFYLAKYYDKIMTTLIDDKEKPERQGEFIIYVVKYFGQSMQYGNQYIYQSMPRLLSLWLDYGTTVVESEKKERGRNSQKLQAQRTILGRINKIISLLSRQLQPYQFFTAFPQLISRICHAHPEVFQQLQDLIAQVLVTYPQQAMWMLMAVSKSWKRPWFSDAYAPPISSSVFISSEGQKMSADIFNSQVLPVIHPTCASTVYQSYTQRWTLTAYLPENNPELHKFIQDATKLAERLLEVSERDAQQSTTFSLSAHFKPLKRLLEDSNFSSILLPLQSAMTVTLPNIQGVSANHNAFPDKQVYIKGLEDTIEVLPSLQKPKKITLIGSDGKFYNMMCKPKDDMRKDCRLMEFNTIVNKFLKKDPESRRRNLHIRTYTVVPLNEECGLVEWVNNTSGLRFILLKLYREKGLYVTGRELKSMMPSIHASLETKMQIFKDRLLPRHPPVFNDWFLRTFPDPTSWYNARLAYARTSAVISMVGYILGLGDRHGENILYDSATGDTVHVDFNCLFNKGETFEWPERVPFRLTHNMVSALGPMGVEGIFRQACEVTLRVMRNQMDPLMSILKPFIYDPLVEWSKPARGQRSNPTESGEISNEQAMNHVQNIEHRLKGILKNKTKPRGLPLSIEGHCNYLIKEATDDKNLSQMYIGWAAYL